MEILLDTHVLLRLLDARLGALPLPMRNAVTDPANTLRVSVASLWEIAIKVRLGKLALSHEARLLPDLLGHMGIALISIDHRHVLANVVPEPETRDPFDRLLLAQCVVEGLRLVTLDRTLADHPFAWRA